MCARLPSLPRAAKGASIGQLVLLTPPKSSHPTSLLYRQQPTPISPLAATLMGLPASVANKRLTRSLSSLDSALTKNRGWGVFWPPCPEPRREREQRVEGSLLLSDQDACPKLIDSEGFGLFINVVFRFQPLQQRLKKRLRLIRRAADGLRHFFGGVCEVAGIGSHSRERQVADPVVCVLLGNLGIQLKGALGVSLALQAARIRIKLNRACLVNGRRKRLRCVVFAAHRVQDARLRLPVLEAVFILNGSVFPFQRLFEIVIVVQAPLRRLVEAGPRESPNAAKFMLDAAQHNVL